MEDNKPWALISEVGKQGYIEEVTDILEEYFHIICHKDFLQNSLVLGPKIQTILMWNNRPAAEPSLLSLLPSLKVVSSGGVGIDHLDVPYIASLGVKMTNTPGVVSDATADIAMALLLASARRIVEGHQIAVYSNITCLPLDLMGVEVTGSTLGIIGMGDIGCKIAQRGKGFDMKILYHNRNRRSFEDEHGNSGQHQQRDHPLLGLPNVLITPHVGTNTIATTRKMVLMMVDNADHPLLGLPNVLITPHVGTNTIATTRKMVLMMVDNALAVLNGHVVPNEVKPKLLH
ncbi:Glyoxylate reductase [Liparis tanakae]|uniref:Glyoxylate reductase n=1 Tax=Liparis tanakae TaxID=230148 RepID=A0A4Z2I4W6_9TELE|nr:Glyoxylate reductase [Liparis tanakae]